MAGGVSFLDAGASPNSASAWRAPRVRSSARRPCRAWSYPEIRGRASSIVAYCSCVCGPGPGAARPCSVHRPKCGLSKIGGVPGIPRGSKGGKPRRGRAQVHEMRRPLAAEPGAPPDYGCSGETGMRIRYPTWSARARPQKVQSPRGLGHGSIHTGSRGRFRGTKSFCWREVSRIRLASPSIKPRSSEEVDHAGPGRQGGRRECCWRQAPGRRAHFWSGPCFAALAQNIWSPKTPRPRFRLRALPKWRTASCAAAARSLRKKRPASKGPAWLENLGEGNDRKKVDHSSSKYWSVLLACRVSIGPPCSPALPAGQNSNAPVCIRHQFCVVRRLGKVQHFRAREAAGAALAAGPREGACW